MFITAKAASIFGPENTRRLTSGPKRVTKRFSTVFDYQEVVDKVYIDVSRAHFWDITAVSALDKIVIKFRREGTDVEVIGLNQASATLVDKFAIHDKDGAEDLLLDH